MLRNLWSAIQQLANEVEIEPNPYYVVCDELDDIEFFARASTNAFLATYNPFPAFAQPDGDEILVTDLDALKRELGDAVRAFGWHRQFNEIVVMFAISNIEPL